MIGNELFLVGVGHSLERVVSSLKIVIELGESISYELLNLLALFPADAGSKWELGEVAADTDAGTLDHLGVLLREGRAFKLSVVHVALVAISKLVLVVVLNDGSEELRE